MYCKKCGAQLADGQLFCGACGTPTYKNDGAEQSRPVDQQPVQPTQQTVNPAPAYQQPPTGVYGSPQADPAMFARQRTPKKNKKPVIVAAVIAAVALLAVVAIICVPMIKRAFMSEQAVMAMYDRDIIEDSLDAIASSAKKTEKNPKYSGSIGVELSDYLAGQLSQYIGEINSAKIAFDVASKKDQYGCRINLSLSETEIISLDVVADIENDKLYITAPGLVDGALELDMSMFMPEDGKASLSSLVENMSALEISDKVIDEVLALIAAADDAAGDAKESTETLTIDGVSQNCTVYTLTLTEETAAKMVVSVLKQLKRSENIKDFAGDLVENYYDGLTREEVISEIDVFCDSGIESLPEEDLVFGDNTIVYKMYTASDDVVGRTIEMNGVRIHAAAVKNGRDVAFEYSLYQEFEGMIEFSGKGTEEKGAFTGAASLTAYENEIINLAFEKFVCEEEKLSGSVALSFGDGIEDITDGEVSAVLSTLGVTLDFDVKDESGKVGIGLSLMGFDLGKIAIESTPDSDYSPSIPEDVKYSDPEEFGNNIDISSLFTRLSQAGFDLSGLMSGMLG